MLLALALLYVMVSTTSAVASFGRPFPSFFTDPYAVYSIVYLPQWDAETLGIEFPDRLTHVEGQPVGREVSLGDYPGGRALDSVQSLHSLGRTAVEISLLRQGQRLDLLVPLRTIGVSEVWVFFGSYAIIACLQLWLGLLIYRHARRRAAARAYLGLSLASFGFLLSFFDYHLGHWLAWAFHLSTIAIPTCLGWVAYSFPTPPRSLSRPMQLLLRAGLVVATIAGALLCFGPWLGHPPDAFRGMLEAVIAIALLSLALTVIVRLRRARGVTRAALRTAALGLAAAPLVVSVTFVATVLLGGAAFHMLLPFGVLALTLGVAYAIVRHDIVATGIVLGWPTLATPAVAIGMVVAGFTTVLLVGPPLQLPLAQALPLGLVVGSGVIAGIFVGLRRALLPAAQHFRPTVEQLAGALAQQTDEAELSHTIERLIVRWLPETSPRMLEAAELERVEDLPPSAASRLDRGELVWLGREDEQRGLLVPIRCLGNLRGVLHLGPKRDGSLFTSDDVALLQTTAGLGGMSLQYARVLREVELARARQLEAGREDKLLALHTLSAEVAHELAYPLNYLRFLLERIEEGRSPGGEDLAVGRDEIERLQRMLSSMRRTTVPSVRMEPVAVEAAWEWVRELVSEIATREGVQLSARVDAGLTVMADRDQLIQLLANLARNAIQASTTGDMVELRARRAADGAILDVCDRGPGIPPALQDSLFSPWVTARPGGSGLGLAICNRIIRSFGWSIDVLREGEETIFRVVTNPDSTRPPAA